MHPNILSPTDMTISLKCFCPWPFSCITHWPLTSGALQTWTLLKCTGPALFYLLQTFLSQSSFCSHFQALTLVVCQLHKAATQPDWWCHAPVILSSLCLPAPHLCSALSGSSPHLPRVQWAVLVWLNQFVPTVLSSVLLSELLSHLGISMS